MLLEESNRECHLVVSEATDENVEVLKKDSDRLKCKLTAAKGENSHLRK